MSSSLSGARNYELGSFSNAAADGDGGGGGGGGGAVKADAAAADDGGLTAPLDAATRAQRDIVLPTASGASTRKRADCLVLDLDGTLLNQDCIITPRTAEALREVVAAGVTVFIATVRGGGGHTLLFRAQFCSHDIITRCLVFKTVFIFNQTLTFFFFCDERPLRDG